MKYIMLFESFVNGRFPVPDTAYDPSVKDFLEEFTSDLSSLGFPLAAEETSYSYTKTPFATLDMDRVVFERWNVEKNELDPKETSKFLKSCDFRFFLEEEDEEDIDPTVFIYHQITPSVNLEKFAQERGFSVLMISWITEPKDKWAQIFVFFAPDAEAAHKHRGRIAGKKYLK